MKKIGAFLLTLASCFALASCGSKKTAAPTTTAPTTTESGGGESSQEQTITSDSASSVMQKLGGKFLFEGNISIEDRGTLLNIDVTLAIDTAGDIDKCFMKSPQGGMYLKENSNDDYLCYFLDDDNNMYTYVSVDSKDDTEDILEAEINGVLGIVTGLTIKYTSENNLTYIGRPCKQYLNTYAKDNAQINEEWVIDNATGICLKHTKVSSANPGVEIKEASTFTVSQFDLTTQVDSCFDTQETYIEVEPWDTTFFKQHGLSDKTDYKVDLDDILNNYTGTKPTIKLDNANSGFTGGNQYGNATYITLEGTNKVTSDFAYYVVESIYNCGAKYDATQLENSLANLVSLDKNDPTDDYYTNIKFYAYSNQIAQYSFEIDFNNPSSKDEASLYIIFNNDALKPQDEPRTYKQDSLEEIMGIISNGYKIDVNIPDYDDDTQIFSLVPSSLAYLNGNIILTDPEGTLYIDKKDNGKYDVYYYDGTNYVPMVDDEYNPLTDLEEDEIKTFIDIEYQLQIACGLSIPYTSKQNDYTYAGRNCTKFIFEDTTPGGTSTREEYIVDKLTGICLMHTKTSDNQSVIDNTTFNVTAYILNTSTEHPVTDFFEAEEGKFVTP